MARPKGHPKSGGRKKNTPNKATTVIKDFRQRLETQKIDVEAELSKAILKGDVDMLRALTGLLPYLSPRLKEAEQKAPEEGDSDEPDISATTTAELYSIIGKGKPSEPISKPIESSES